MRPTDKQISRVERIIDRLGKQKVHEYITVFWPDSSFESLTKDQAQKIITGLGHRITKPIYGVVGRDIPFSR